ncbi:MAG: NosD domain-containing protein, partial [Planctomycetota bacterium]
LIMRTLFPLVSILICFFVLCVEKAEAQTYIPHPTIPLNAWVDDDYNASTPGWQRTRFDHIQDGVDAVGKGGTVFVFAGTYYEHVLLNKVLKLKGEDRDTTFINGSDSGDVVIMTVDGVAISGFSVEQSGHAHYGLKINSNGNMISDCVFSQNWSRAVSLEESTKDNIVSENLFSQNSYGVYLDEYSRKNLISDNIFIDNSQYDIFLKYTTENTISSNDIGSNIYYGLYLYYSDFNEIIGNESHSHTKGIYLMNSHHNVISQNHIHHNTYMGIEAYACDYLVITDNAVSDNTHAGIHFTGCDQSTISDNRIENNERYGIDLNSSSYDTVKDNSLIMNGLGIWGTILDHWNTHTIENNSVNEKPIYYYKDQTGVTVPSDAASVILAHCTQCILADLELADADYGVQLAFSSQNTVSGCFIHSNTGMGMRVEYSSLENHIEGNLIADNGWNGIQISNDSANNMVKGNTITGNDYGIRLGTDANTVEDNAIIDNEEGMSISYGNGNLITGNIIAGNREGFEGHGIHLTNTMNNIISENVLSDNLVGLYSVASSDHIFHNSFVLNDINAYDLGANTWDNGYPSGGNCWDDYLGQDLNGDGIGDSFHPIPGAGNQDPYPLMSPWGRNVLCGNSVTLSVDDGGQVSFTLFAGKPEAGRNYVLLGSISGTSPGFPLPGGLAILPLNWDSFTDYVIQSLNTPIFTDFMGNLDGEGMGFAQFDTFGPLPSVLSGLSFSFAYALYPPWDEVSNPLNVKILP